MKAIIFLAGVILGVIVTLWWTYDPVVWDLWEDPRGCVISWDDGTYSYKSREITLGTLKPGESKCVYILEEANQLSNETLIEAVK